MLSRVCIAVFSLVMLLATCSAQTSPAAQPNNKGLGVADVVKLLESGIGEDVVIAKVKQEGKAFDLSTDDILELKKAGATGAVLKAMMNPNPNPEPGHSAGSPPAQPSDLPDEQGVYVRVRGEWQAVVPEIVNMRTAGMLGHAFSAGISKAKMKGDVQGNKSKLQIATPVEILIKCAEGISPAEYQILQMEEKGGRREFEAMEIGFASAQTGARKGIVEAKFEKVSKATYKTTLSNLKKGEYGILPPGAATSATTASAGKVYAFGIIE